MTVKKENYWSWTRGHVLSELKWFFVGSWIRNPDLEFSCGAIIMPIAAILLAVQVRVWTLVITAPISFFLITHSLWRMKNDS